MALPKGKNLEVPRPYASRELEAVCARYRQVPALPADEARPPYLQALRVTTMASRSSTWKPKPLPRSKICFFKPSVCDWGLLFIRE